MAKNFDEIDDETIASYSAAFEKQQLQSDTLRILLSRQTEIEVDLIRSRDSLLTRLQSALKLLQMLKPASSSTLSKEALDNWNALESLLGGESWIEEDCSHPSRCPSNQDKDLSSVRRDTLASLSESDECCDDLDASYQVLKVQQKESQTSQKPSLKYDPFRYQIVLSPQQELLTEENNKSNNAINRQSSFQVASKLETPRGQRAKSVIDGHVAIDSGFRTKARRVTAHPRIQPNGYHIRDKASSTGWMESNTSRSVINSQSSTQGTCIDDHKTGFVERGQLSLDYSHPVPTPDKQPKPGARQSIFERHVRHIAGG